MLFVVAYGLFSIALTILFTLLALLLVYGLLVYITHVYNLKNYPPGPFPLPFIGNLRYLGEKPYLTFRDLAKVYGDVFSISLGMQRIVIINKIEQAKEALITKSVEFAGRPTDHYIFQLISRGNRNISFTDYGPHWKLNRKLGHSALRMYGEDAGKIECKVVRECEELCSRLKETIGQPVDLNPEIGNAVGNIICSTVFGERYEINDPRFLQIINFINLVLDGFSPRDPVAYIPWIRHFVRLEGLEKIKKALAIRDDILHTQLENHRKTFDPDNIRDLTDSLIKASREKELWANIGINEVTDDHIEMIMNDMFIAGSHTTSGTLRWCVLYLLHWPKYQDLIYNEIIEVIGTKRYPVLSDRPSLPLLQATIQETLRLSSLAPMGIPHKTTQDVIIDGDKHIPQNTQVMFNLWSMHHDEGEWDKPHEFNPYRWLDEDNKYIPGRHKSFLPFSAGRRVCLGEPLAKTELFLIFSRLMRNFKISHNSDEPFPGLEGKTSLVLFPPPYTVRLSLRCPVENDL